MLLPCAVKRTEKPFCNNSRQVAANCAESFFTAFGIVDLSARMADRLHGARLRQKAKSIAGQFPRKLLDELQRQVQRLWRVARHETARKDFRGRNAARHGHEFVGGRLFENVDVRESRRAGRSDAGVAMPRRAVHPHLAFAPAENDAVVAQDAPAPLRLLRLPQTRAGALARARMSEEKMAEAGFVNDAERVYFQTFSARQMVNHQDFIERILEGIDRSLGVEEMARER